MQLSFRPIGLMLTIVVVTTLVPAAISTRALASGSVATSAVVTTAGPTATKVRRVSPVASDGRLRPGYRVVATRRGYCWTSSFHNGRAYRCLMGNFIMDPCWREAGRRSVVCLLEPWTSRVTRLRLTRPLPATAPYGGGIWGLRLGARIDANCLVSTGASGFIGKHHISYFCTRGWVLLDAPNRHSAVWTIATARRIGNHYVLRGPKPLHVAWKATVL